MQKLKTIVRCMGILLMAMDSFTFMIFIVLLNISTITDIGVVPVIILLLFFGLSLIMIFAPGALIYKMPNKSRIDKKGFSEMCVRAAFADNEGFRLFETAVSEYEAGNRTRGVVATIQAGYNLVYQNYITNSREIPVGLINVIDFTKHIDELTKQND